MTMPDSPFGRPLDAAFVATLPPSLQALVAGCVAVPASAGESGATVLRLAMAGGGACYLKSAHGDAAEALSDELVRLAWFAGRLPVPAVRHFVRSGDSAALLTDALAGTSARDAIEADPACVEAIAAAAGAFVRTLHTLPVDDCPFRADVAVRIAAARRALDAGTVDADDFDDARAGRTPHEVWDELLAMLPLPFTAAVVHGDCTLDNLLVHDGRVTGCLDVGRAGVGDPHQDLALLLRDLAPYGDAATRACLDASGLATPDARRLDFFRCLDEFF